MAEGAQAAAAADGVIAAGAADHAAAVMFRSEWQWDLASKSCNPAALNCSTQPSTQLFCLLS